MLLCVPRTEAKGVLTQRNLLSKTPYAITTFSSREDPDKSRWHHLNMWMPHLFQNSLCHHHVIFTGGPTLAGTPKLGSCCMYPGEADLGHEHVGAAVQSRLPGARRPTQRGQVAAARARGFRELAGLGPELD